MIEWALVIVAAVALATTVQMAVLCWRRARSCGWRRVWVTALAVPVCWWYWPRWAWRDIVAGYREARR